MKPAKRNQRLLQLGGAGVALAGAAVLVFSALQENVAYFYSPLQIKSGEADLSRSIRLGGLVVAGSITRGAGTLTKFDVTDGAETIQVRYDGVLPDLFREGQGVIAQGSFAGEDFFTADLILAKHDENYRPRELEEALADGAAAAAERE